MENKSNQFDKSMEEENEILVINSHSLKLTHLNKVFWSDQNYSKGDLINYYRQVAPYILPYLKDRPESLNRFPNGIQGSSFFQKDMGALHPEWVKTEKIYSESNDKEINYLVCQNEATLIYMVNLGCIEINPWSSRIAQLENPDYVIIDIDPLNISFDFVIETALAVKEVLDQVRIKAYCKTSGATGLHVYIPLGAKYHYEQARQFAKVIAFLTHQRLPTTTSMERSPSKRKKKVYLDFLQNSYGQTIAAPYCVRPKPKAPVSTPLEWEEVKVGLNPIDFNMQNTMERLKRKGDLFKPILGKGINLQDCLNQLEEIVNEQH